MNQNSNLQNDADIQQNKMGVLPIGRLVFSMSWPATLSMMIQALYNIVDSIFVATISEEALTAVTLVFPIQMLMIAMAVGTGIGINSLIARRLGEQRLEEANKAASNGFRMAFLNWAIFAVFGLFFSKTYMEAYSSNAFIVENGTKYLFLVTVFSLFIMIQINIEKILQATGNMLIPMICSLIGAFTNIVLAAVFIFGLLGFPRMGVFGAGLATITAQCLSMCLGLIFLFKGKHIVHVKIRGFKIDWKIIRQIYAVGLPSILMQSIGSFMLFGLNVILASISETAVAVLGAYFRLQSFIFLPVFGVNQGTLPILGYNFGARNKERFMRAFKCALGAALVIMFLGLLLFQTLPKELLLMFSASDEMLAIGIPALKLISLCFLPAAVGIVAASVFQATGHGMTSLWGALLRQLVCVLPIAWLLARTADGAYHVWGAFPLAEIFGLLYSVIMLKHIYNKEIKDM